MDPRGQEAVLIWRWTTKTQVQAAVESLPEGLQVKAWMELD